jgi:hypothetical protein
LAVVRGIYNAERRALALAEIAPRLPAEEQSAALGEALAAAHAIDDPERGALALAKIAPQLPAEEQPAALGEALAAARGIDDVARRVQALAAVAQRFTKEQAANFPVRQWLDTVRVLAMRGRGDCVTDLVSILPVIDAIDGEAAIRSLGRSIITVGLWWPSSAKCQLLN